MIELHPGPAELIAGSLDRPLSADERRTVERHTVECEACRRLEHALRADALALSVPLHLAPPLRVRAEIERQVAIPSLEPGLVRTIRVAVATALVLVLVVVLALALALLHPRPTTPNQTLAPEPAGLHRSEGSW